MLFQAGQSTKVRMKQPKVTFTIDGGNKHRSFIHFTKEVVCQLSLFIPHSQGNSEVCVMSQQQRAAESSREVESRGEARSVEGNIHQVWWGAREDGINFSNTLSHENIFFLLRETKRGQSTLLYVHVYLCKRNNLTQQSQNPSIIFVLKMFFSTAKFPSFLETNKRQSTPLYAKNNLRQSQYLSIISVL